MAVRTYTFGVRFRGKFNGGTVARQAGIDWHVYNRLLAEFRDV